MGKISENKGDERKLFIRVTPEMDDRFTAWAKRLGVTKSQFGNICVQAGLSALIRAIAPEEAFTAQQLIELIREAEKQGLPVDLKSLTEKGANL